MSSMPHCNKLLPSRSNCGAVQTHPSMWCSAKPWCSLCWLTQAHAYWAMSAQGCLVWFLWWGGVSVWGRDGRLGFVCGVVMVGWVLEAGKLDNMRSFQLIVVVMSWQGLKAGEGPLIISCYTYYSCCCACLCVPCWLCKPLTV